MTDAVPDLLSEAKQVLVQLGELARDGKFRSRGSVGQCFHPRNFERAERKLPKQGFAHIKLAPRRST